MKRDYLESLGLGHLPDEAITLAEKYENPAAMTFAGIVIQLEAFELAMHGINTAASASELNAYSVIYDGEISLRHMMRGQIAIETIKYTAHMFKEGNATARIGSIIEATLGDESI